MDKMGLVPACTRTKKILWLMLLGGLVLLGWNLEHASLVVLVVKEEKDVAAAPQPRLLASRNDTGSSSRTSGQEASIGKELGEPSVTAPTTASESQSHNRICMVRAKESTLPESTTSDGVQYFLFDTNQEGQVPEGWERLVVSTPMEKRFLKHYAKYMAWQEARIQDSCDAVFFLESKVEHIGTARDLHNITEMLLDHTASESRSGFFQDESLLHERGGFLEEIKDLLLQQADMHAMMRFLWQNPRFLMSVAPVRRGSFLGIKIPVDPFYQKMASDFWETYTKDDAYQWNERLLWAFILWKHNAKPLRLPEEMTNSSFSVVKTEAPLNSTRVLKVAFLNVDVGGGSMRMRGTQIANELLRQQQEDPDGSMMGSNITRVVLPSMHKCGQMKGYCADICVFIGPCQNLKASFHCCKLRVLDVIDKYLLRAGMVQSTLRHYDSVIPTNYYMANHFRTQLNYTGDMKVLWQQSDPRWEETKTIPSPTSPNVLRFAYIGSLPSLKHTNSFLFGKELLSEPRFAISLLNTERGKIPKEVKFDCDLSLRIIDSKVAKFKPGTKVATAAAMRHNIITTWDESVKDVLPADYPFALSNSSWEALSELMDMAMADYAGNRTLWNKGLEMMKQVHEKVSVTAIVREYRRYFERLGNMLDNQ